MKHLAIIDDDPEILKLLEQYLTKNGFEVRAFTDGESFLKEDESNFSLIVLDIGLPGIDGLEVCKRVRWDGCLIKLGSLTGYTLIKKRYKNQARRVSVFATVQPLI